MDELNRSSEDVVVRSNYSLVPITRVQTKVIVSSAMRSVFARTGRSIGVSSNWLIKHVEQLALNQDEVETLVTVRTEFGALLPHAVKLLYKGLTVEDVYGCYRTRQSLASMGDHRCKASLKSIALFIRTFPEADPDNEDLDEMIFEVHQIVSERNFWTPYIDQSISIICAIADKYGCATIEGALAVFDSRNAQRSIDDMQNDEVARQRTACENDQRNHFE